MKVTDVIARLAAEGDAAQAWWHAHAHPVPLETALQMPGGGPVPAELATWLAYDATWLPLVEHAKDAAPRLAVSTVHAILASWAAAMMPEGGADGFTRDDAVRAWRDLLPADAHPDATAIELPPSGSQEHMLVIGPNETCRVLGCHKRYEFWWKYASFGDFLGHYFGYESPD